MLLSSVSQVHTPPRPLGFTGLAWKGLQQSSAQSLRGWPSSLQRVPCLRGATRLLAPGGFQTFSPSLLSTSPPQGFLGALTHPRTSACPELPQCHPGPTLCALSEGQLCWVPTHVSGRFQGWAAAAPVPARPVSFPRSCSSAVAVIAVCVTLWRLGEGLPSQGSRHPEARCHPCLPHCSWCGLLPSLHAQVHKRFPPRASLSGH